MLKSRHCVDYALLVDFHTGYGRGLYSLEADEHRKLIRFVTNKGLGSTPVHVGILESTPREWTRIRSLAKGRPTRQELIALISSMPHHIDEGRIVIEDFRSLTEPLQLAMDNGARRALIPIENKRHFLDVSADIMERVDPVFYSDPLTAAMKALGMT